MNNEFLVGQIVRADEDYAKVCGTCYDKSRVLQNSTHVLTEKDIERGYYFTNIGSFDLSQCEVVDDHLQYYRTCTRASGYDHSLLGAVTKPISMLKYFRIATINRTEVITTYIFIQDRLTKVTGDVYDGSLYWMGMSNDQYRTKLRTTKEGYVVGRDVLISMLSSKQKRLCFNLNKEKQL